MITPKPHIAAMQAFALADLSAPPGLRVISLAQNESAFPPSPRAMDAARAALENAERYPDPDWSTLRSAIAERHGVDPANILCRARPMDLTSALIIAFSAPRDRLPVSSISPPEYRELVLSLTLLAEREYKYLKRCPGQLTAPPEKSLFDK